MSTFRAVAVATWLGLLGSGGLAQTIIVNETFDQYADDAALLAQWVPTTGGGTEAIAPGTGTYFNGVLTNDDILFPGIQGKAVDYLPTSGGSVMQYGGVIDQLNGLNPAFAIAPSATESVLVRGDFYYSATGGLPRMSIGLRYVNTISGSAVSTNLIELGMWNAEAIGYAYRGILFGPPTNPNWQFFQLPPELDINASNTVTPFDIGPGWHRYSAIITPTAVTFEIDLWRDGLRNTSREVDIETGIRPGTPGVDASITWDMAAIVDGDGVAFNSLRIGTASGISSVATNDTAFDNVVLALVPAAPAGITINVPTGDTQTQTQAGYPLLSGTAPVTKTGDGTLVLDQANTMEGPLTLQAGTTVAANVDALGDSVPGVAEGAVLQISPAIGAANAVQIADLGTIDGQIDVGTGRFALPASGESPGAELRSLLIAGRSGGTWDGTSGIMSSDAPSSGGGSGFAVGYRVAGDNSATVAWASLGDADLDGAVTTADVNAILTSGLLNTGTPGAVWQQGDFDYDGLVTTADINALLTTGRLNSGSYLPATPPTSSVTAVPEPSTLGLLAGAGLSAWAAARRRFGGRAKTA